MVSHGEHSDGGGSNGGGGHSDGHVLVIFLFLVFLGILGILLGILLDNLLLYGKVVKGNTGFENQILKGPLTRGLKRVARPTEGLGFRGGENH